MELSLVPRLFPARVPRLLPWNALPRRPRRHFRLCFRYRWVHPSGAIIGSGYTKSRRLVLRIVRLFATHNRPARFAEDRLCSEKPKLPQGKPAGFIVPRGLSGGVQREVSILALRRFYTGGSNVCMADRGSRRNEWLGRYPPKVKLR